MAFIQRKTITIFGDACSCPYAWLTIIYLTAPQHLCINACSCSYACSCYSSKT